MSGSRPARIAVAIAVGAFMFAMSCRVVADEAPLEVASLADPAFAATPPAFLDTRGDEPFGLPTSLKAGAKLDAKWQDAEQAIRDDLAAVEQCRAVNSCNPQAKALITMADDARPLAGRVRLGAVNRAVNLAIASVTDLAQHGVEDVWSSPLATLGTRKGDCEDYAILKIAVLQAAGMAAGDLRLVVVRDSATNEGHAVAAARLDGRWLLLDNRRFTLVDADHSFYRPYFALHLHEDRSRIGWAQGPSGSGASPVLL